MIGTFRQLPVRPGYAITVHKAQGQSLDKVTLKLGSRWPEIFSCGQLYVALSRATSMDGLYIDGNLEKIKVLASEDFLNFQNNTLDTCASSINPEEVPVSEEEPEETSEKPSASDSRTISIKCPAYAAKAIFSFAQALTPDAELVDNVLILPEEYKQAVKTFVEVIL
ncbi:helicase C-terminal domain-containing protein [Blautia sp.]|uniref:helicase C-terminal domain-containing protein n=1 Tax=Blautia sp. TaxID=1955243 RepID=UPI002ED043F0